MSQTSTKIQSSLSLSEHVENFPKWLDRHQWATPRWKSAIARHKLSMPMRVAINEIGCHRKYRLLDFGSGRGEDVKLLRQDSIISASGFDPCWCKCIDRLHEHDILTLIYVVNVIECPQERLEVVRYCWDLTGTYFVVAVRTDGKGEGITKIGTFQKYFTAASFKSFLVEALGNIQFDYLRSGLAIIKK